MADAEKGTDNDAEVKDDSKSSVTFEKLGMTVKNLTDKEKEKYNVTNGVLISKTALYGKAQQEYLQDGLVITSADKKKIESVSQLEKIVNAKKGAAVLLEVTDGKGNTRFVGLEVPE